MHFDHVQYLPIAPPLFALLAGALVLLLILVQIRVLRYAYMQLGVSSGTAFFLLFASLLGSYVNIPIAALGEEVMVTEREVTFFGMRYIVPALVEPPEVVLAVNVGGAVIRLALDLSLVEEPALGTRPIAFFASPRSATSLLSRSEGSESDCQSSWRLWPQPSSLLSSPGATRRRWPTPAIALAY